MAKFEVLNCVTDVEYIQKKRVVDKEGNMHMRETLLTRPNKPGFYGVEDVKIGDVIELTDARRIDKARRNPDLKEVKDAPKKKAKKKAAKKD